MKNAALLMKLMLIDNIKNLINVKKELCYGNRSFKRN